MHSTRTRPHASNANFGAKIAHTIRCLRACPANAALANAPTPRSKLSVSVADATRRSRLTSTAVLLPIPPPPSSSSSPPSSPTASSPSDEPPSDETVVTVASAIAGNDAQSNASPAHVSVASSAPIVQNRNRSNPTNARANRNPSNAHRRPPAWKNADEAAYVAHARPNGPEGASVPSNRFAARRRRLATSAAACVVRERDPHGAAVPGEHRERRRRGPRGGERRTSAVSVFVSVFVSVSSPRRDGKTPSKKRAPGGPFFPPAPRVFSSFRIRASPTRAPAPRPRTSRAEARARGPEPTEAAPRIWGRPPKPPPHSRPPPRRRTLRTATEMTPGE